jgi:hypothetical protein
MSIIKKADDESKRFSNDNNNQEVSKHFIATGFWILCVDETSTHLLYKS